MQKYRTAIFCLVLLSVSNLVIASGNINNAEITRIDSYTSYSGTNFDLVIQLSTGCPSGGEFYLPNASSTNNVNMDQVYSLLLAAFMGGKTVNLNYQENSSPNFTSASNHCEVRRVWVNK